MLSREEERTLVARAQTGEQAARDVLVERNMGLVRKEAAYFQADGMEFEDFIIEGVIGLISAIDRFDPDRGTKFSTYAVPWIRQAIRRAIEKQSRLVRLPSHVCESLRGREWPVAFCRALRLDEPMPSGDTLADFIPGGVDPAQLGPTEIALTCLAALTDIPKEEQQILAWRYGLDDGICLSLREVAERFPRRVTRQQISNIEQRALRRLRYLLRGTHETNEPDRG